MKTFNMYVKIVVTSEHDKILLLKEKKIDYKPRWDLPGAPLTDEESFDETVIANIQKEIGYIVYPGKILGVNSFIEKETKKLYVIMEGSILGGNLVLSKNYDDYVWINRSRLNDYPLNPWLKDYIKTHKYPFQDVELEINQLNEKENKRSELIKENIANIDSSPFNIETENLGDSMKSSFGLLKSTIKRTFHPKAAEITHTQPRNNLYSDVENQKIDLKEKINNIPKKPKRDTSEDIIVEHEEKTTKRPNNIIKKAENYTKDIHTDTLKNIKPKETLKNRIKTVKKDQKVPHIRKEKESDEKISFNSEQYDTPNWKKKINDFNKTDANKDKKIIPRPKGKKRE